MWLANPRARTERKNQFWSSGLEASAIFAESWLPGLVRTENTELGPDVAAFLKMFIILVVMAQSLR